MYWMETREREVLLSFDQRLIQRNALIVKQQRS
jgi:hypothetical protein